jgi:hypothetical protein
MIEQTHPDRVTVVMILGLISAGNGRKESPYLEAVMGWIQGIEMDESLVFKGLLFKICPLKYARHLYF